MGEATTRAMFKDRFDASNISSPGGGPRDEIARLSASYSRAIIGP
jgi:hypothetical protein